MKNTDKKLNLSKEIIKSLNQAQMAQVNGGNTLLRRTGGYC